MAALDTESRADDSGTGTARPPRRRRRRRGLFRASLVWTHRWTSLVLGIALVVITTSGALLLYKPEYFQVTHQALFTSTPGAHPVSMSQAMAAAEKAVPGFESNGADLAYGVFLISSEDLEAPTVFVDPGTGKVNGTGHLEEGVIGFLDNLHECALSCEDYPGYLSFMAATPFAPLGWSALDEYTVGSMLLGLSGLFLLFLALSGVVLWWPGVKRFAMGWRVRWRRGRYARDYDLHQVAGMLTVPFLLMWAITGAGFEFPVRGEGLGVGDRVHAVRLRGARAAV